MPKPVQLAEGADIIESERRHQRTVNPVLASVGDARAPLTIMPLHENAVSCVLHSPPSVAHVNTILACTGCMNDGTPTGV